MSNVFERMSPRSIRVIYTVFALMVIALSSYNFIYVMYYRAYSNDQCQWLQVYTDTTRIHVIGLAKDGAAERAGLMDGDIITAVDGRAVSRAKEVVAHIERAAAGDTILLGIDRDHRARTLAYLRGPDEKEPSLKLDDRIFETLVITRIVEDGVTDRAGIEDGDILLRIDSVSINNRYGAQYLLNVHPAGSMASFLVERDGALLHFDVEVLKTFNYTYFASFLLGFGFLLVGYFVVMARPEGSIQRKFARFGIHSMLFFGMSAVVASYIYDPAWRVQLFIAGAFIARTIAPPIFVSFFLHFPVRRPSAGKRWLLPVLYGGSAIATLFMAEYYLHFMNLKLPTILVQIAGAVPFVYFLIGLGFFVHGYFFRVEAVSRKQLRPIFLSAIIGVVAFVYVVILQASYPFAIFLQPYLLIPALLIVGIPPAFGYSIIKHRLMDITVIIKRSIMYGLFTAAIAAIYLGVVFGLGSFLGTALGQTDNKLLSLVAFILIALLFDPLKRRVQRVVDRIFYRERYNYQKALLEFSRELPQQINLEQILGSVVNRISSTMHVEKVSVSLCDESEGCHVFSRNIAETFCNFTDIPGGVLELLRDTKEPQSFALLDEDRRITNSDDRSKLHRSGIVLMVPMFLKDRLIGSINVGPKQGGGIYSQEDMDLLSTVGSQAAIAIENARLHRSEIEKQKISEQLKIAQRIQQGLLPKSNPPIAQLDIAGVSIPALTVGGDYYDYIELPGNRLLIAVGDVSGKGMSAALYMSKVQGMIRFAAQLYDSPKRILSSVNRLIYEGIERNSFITMILALFDLDQQTVTVCRAGHTQPLVAMNGSMSFMGSEGMGLGLEPGDIFDRSLEERIVPLRKDGLILLYSDGLTEAMDVDMNEFGEERLFEVLSNSRSATSSELQETLLREVENHRDGAEQNDDITLVVVRVR